MRAAHPEAPRTLWAHVADDAPLPKAMRAALATRAHPTLTSLRMRLGPRLDTSGLQAEYVALRTTSADVGDRRAARRLLERLHRALRSERDIMVRIVADGGVSVSGAGTTWPLRRGGAEWAWLRVFNESDQPLTVVVSAGERVRSLRLPALGSRSYLQRLPTDEASDLIVTASIGGQNGTWVVRLDTRPTRLLTVLLADGPARLQLSDELGPVVPPGLVGRRDLHGHWYVHLRRRLAVPVVGDAHVEVRRGPEFEPFRSTLVVRDGADDKLSIQLHRRIDLAQNGWLSADLHAHLHYGGEYLLDAADAALAQQAEGLWFLNLVVANQESDVVHDRSFFVPEPLVAADSVTSWGEEFRNDFYGHVCLTRPRQLVEPVYSGFGGTDQPFDYPTTVNVAQQSRQVGALVSSAHPLISSRSISDVFRAPRSVEAKELPVLAALRLVDAVDVMSYPGDALLTAQLWYRLLNCGFRLAATAGGDAFMNVADGEAFMHGEPGVIAGSGGRFSSPVGGVRVYARAERRDRDGLCNAIAAGRTFVTNGPFIGLKVDGMEPGTVIERRPGAQVTVDATISSWVPIDALELVVNGRVRRRRPIDLLPVEDQVSWTLPIDGPAWIAVRAVGGPDRDVMDDYAFAHTSPVYIDVDGRPVQDPVALRYFQRWIDRLLRALTSDCQFAEEWQEREVRGFYEQARQVYAQASEST